MKHNPYFSHADRPIVIAEHEAKRLTDPLHIMIDQDMRTLAKSNSKGRRVQRFFDPSILRKGLTVDAALLMALDYNTVRGSVFCIGRTHASIKQTTKALKLPVWRRSKLS